MAARFVVRSALIGVAVSMALVTAHAQVEECLPTTSSENVALLTPDTQSVSLGSTQDWLATFYVVNDLCQPQCLFSVWIYQETNGMEGLQRSDPLHDDTCDGIFASDHIIF